MLQKELERQGNWLFRHRGALPLVALCAGFCIYLFSKLHPDEFSLAREPWKMVYQDLCLAVGLAGLAVRVYAVGHTPAGTSGRNTAEGQLAEKVNTTGIYSVVRHPLYLGNFLMWLGIALLTANVWFVLLFCAVFWIYYERIMYAEEQFMSRKFGDEYRTWADRTPAFFPNFRLFVKPALPFSWKKAMKKEKNGLVALFAVFFLFDAAGETIAGTRDYNLLFAIGFGVSLVAYCILKYLKRKTTLLDEPGR